MATIDLQEATDLIRRWLSRKGKADNTVKAYSTDIKMFFLEMDLSTVSVAELETIASNWMNQRRRKVTPKTLARRITSMRALGACLGVPVLSDYSAPTAVPALPHPLPGLIKDLEAMLAVAHTPLQRTLIGLTGLCGLRIGEAREVGPDDFDLHNMSLRVRGKGDKTRIVPISKLAWSVISPSVLSAMLNKSPTVIVVADRHARLVLTRLGERAGISRPVSSHDMRATFATVAYKNSGNNIRAVQQLLGHSSVVQTQLYVGTSFDEMRDAASFQFADDEGDED